jgi:hypothetical protein
MRPELEAAVNAYTARLDAVINAPAVEVNPPDKDQYRLVPATQH